jgi:hypothetical protein
VLYTVKAGETKQIVYSASRQNKRPVTSYLVANLDTVNQLYIGHADEDRQVPDLAADLTRSIIAPLQAISVASAHDWFAFNPASGSPAQDVYQSKYTATYGITGPPGPSVQVDVIPNGTYWAPSPAQVAQQLNALGLALDSTVSGLPTNLQNMGIPSFVPNAKSASIRNQGTGQYTFASFSAAARIWAAHLSFAITANGSYGTNSSQVYARVQTKSGLDLSVVEVAVSGPSTNDSGDADLSIPGISVAAGDGLILDVNGGNGIVNVVMHASAVVIYSVP